MREATNGSLAQPLQQLINLFQLILEQVNSFQTLASCQSRYLSPKHFILMSFLQQGNCEEKNTMSSRPENVLE